MLVLEHTSPALTKIIQLRELAKHDIALIDLHKQLKPTLYCFTVEARSMFVEVNEVWNISETLFSAVWT